MEQQTVYSVSRLNQESQSLLENHFAYVWVEGEISNLARPGSGHLYFSLKDEQAQIACALFRQRALRLRFQPTDGQWVRVYAQVTLYPLQGRFQLRVERMEATGEGALQRAFAELKAKLQAEGLFDARHQRPLPVFARQIGVISSLNGAALRDILSVLQRRFPAIAVWVYPSLVQGSEAPAQLMQALALANAHACCDALILARGGGSLEDLQAFNDEALARAICCSRIPVVSAVGHEVDFTIADFVADARAPTPSAAAELLSPEQHAVYAQLQMYRQRLQRSLATELRQQQAKLQHLQHRLHQQQPTRRLFLWAQRLDELEQRLHTRMAYLLTQAQARLASNARALQAVSPLATLARGYAVLQDAEGHIITQAAQTHPAQCLSVRLAQGELRVQVLEAAPQSPVGDTTPPAPRTPKGQPRVRKKTL